MRRLDPLPPRPPTPEDERGRVHEQVDMLLSLLDLLHDGTNDLRAIVKAAKRQAQTDAYPALLAAIRAQLPGVTQAADAIQAVAARARDRIDQHLSTPAA